jgi:hypothetical protein
MAMLQMCTGVAHWYSPHGRMTLDQVSAAFVTMSLALLGGGAGPHAPAAAVAEGGGLA